MPISHVKRLDYSIKTFIIAIMTFEKISSDTACDVISQAVEDTTSNFVRVLSKADLNDKDFMSKWDKGTRSELCDKVKGLKGISVSNVNETGVLTKVLALYKTTFKLSPKYKLKVIEFNFKNGAGLVKPTPSNKNQAHHDFYKADDFTTDFINEIFIHQIDSVVQG